MTNHDQSPAATPEVPAPLGLQDGLASFEGTPFTSFIKTALEGAGINPRGYEPVRYGHDNYYGLLSTAPGYDHETSNPSPIVVALREAVQAGEIVQDRPEPDTLRFPHWNMHIPDAHTSNAWRTAKLFAIGLIAFRDVRSGEIVAYGSSLQSDGGRQGYAILSTNDLVSNGEAR